jgi:hypothetical protein
MKLADMGTRGQIEGRREGRRWQILTWLPHRWPSAAGMALALLTGLGIASAADVAPVVTASGFVYLGAAALQRPSAAWPMFLVAFILITISFLVPAVDPSWWMLGLAACLVAYGLTRGALRPQWGVPLQSVAMVMLAAVAITAVHVGATWAGFLVAVSLLAHAAWDAYHHHVQRVVVRSMAEFCAVLDTLLAIVVIAVTLV